MPETSRAALVGLCWPLASSRRSRRKRAAIYDYTEVFYNRQRRHQTLGYVSPVQFEQL